MTKRIRELSVTRQNIDRDTASRAAGTYRLRDVTGREVGPQVAMNPQSITFPPWRGYADWRAHRTKHPSAEEIIARDCVEPFDDE
jgi:hypothetical protein